MLLPGSRWWRRFRLVEFAFRRLGNRGDSRERCRDRCLRDLVPRLFGAGNRRFLRRLLLLLAWWCNWSRRRPSAGRCGLARLGLLRRRLRRGAFWPALIFRGLL